MAEAGDGNILNSQPKCSPTAITDAPITDPGSTIKNIEGSNAFVGQRKLESKSAAALKKSSRYRSRSLSASSNDSYSSGPAGLAAARARSAAARQPGSEEAAEASAR